MSAFLARTPISIASDWRSRGFAIAGDGTNVEGEDWSRAIAIRGKAYEFAADAARFEVDVEAPPKSEDDWAGISGTPVFVGGVVYGIVCNGANRFAGNRLLALPSSRLLSDSEFVAAAALPQTQRAFGELSDRLRGILESDESVRAMLFAAREESRGRYREGGADALAQYILTRPVAELVAWMDEAHARCCDAGSSTDETARAMMTLLATVLPWASIESLSSDISSSATTVLTLPTANAMTAELMMAGWDGREFRFGAAASRFPPPLADVGNRVGFGFDPEGEDQFRDLSVRLARWLLDVEVPLDSQLTPSQLTELNDDIQFRANRYRDSLRYYLVLTARQARQSTAFLRHVEERLSELRVVVLSQDSNREENQICRHLRDLVHRHQTGREYRPE
ncbi:MAG: hypothetical protein GY946_10830 [bacterium]|nr:hypothetical protein [bacterium]